MLSPGWLDFTFGRFGLRDWMLNAQRYDGADGSQEQGLYLYATEHATTGQPGRRLRRPSLRVVVLIVCQKIEKKGTGQQRGCCIATTFEKPTVGLSPVRFRPFAHDYAPIRDQRS